jgi:hypothetical protein
MRIRRILKFFLQVRPTLELFHVSYDSWSMDHQKAVSASSSSRFKSPGTSKKIESSSHMGFITRLRIREP